jgi:hypothetical protein
MKLFEFPYTLMTFAGEPLASVPAFVFSTGTSALLQPKPHAVLSLQLRTYFISKINFEIIL